MNTSYSAGLNHFSGSLIEITVEEVQSALQMGRLSSLELVRFYAERIRALDWNGPCLRSVIELNSDAEKIALTLDLERRRSGPRSLLHGLPVLLKDNIDTADRLLTTAGSWALVGSRPRQDAFIVHKLRRAGAVILGKTNLTEWSSFRSTHKSSGWSGRGGQCRNPYLTTHSPFGSTSGSAVAVSANLCTLAVGTETDGSIVNPAHVCGVVGIKPTVGLTSRGGIIPISHSQDTVGPLARTVKDAAILLGFMAGYDPHDPATMRGQSQSYSDYTCFLRADGLKGARIGVARKIYTGYNRHADAVFEAAIRMLREEGAVLVDPADIPTAREIRDSPDAMTVLTYEFKHALNAYLAKRLADSAYPGYRAISSLADVIAYNLEYPEQELTYFGQEILEMAEACGPLTDPAYLIALHNNQRRGGRDGIDAVMERYKLDALVAPTGQPAWPIDLLNGDHITGVSSTPAAVVGYPIITVPAGTVSGLPVGISFIGKAWSELTLIRLAYAFEQISSARKPPQFL